MKYSLFIVQMVGLRQSILLRPAPEITGQILSIILDFRRRFQVRPISMHRAARRGILLTERRGSVQDSGLTEQVMAISICGEHPMMAALSGSRFRLLLKKGIPIILNAC